MRRNNGHTIIGDTGIVEDLGHCGGGSGLQ